MTRGRQGSGIQTRVTDYRCRFTWRGVRYEIPVALKPSLANTKHLERVMREVRAAIAIEQFTFERFFPDSDQAKAERLARSDQPKEQTFGDAADTWKRTRGAPLSAWQQEKDRLYVKFWKEKIGVDRVMRTIVPSTLEALVAEHPWPSAKHRNNLLTSLRGIFELWVKEAGVHAQGLDNSINNSAGSLSDAFAGVCHPISAPWGFLWRAQLGRLIRRRLYSRVAYLQSKLR